MARAVLRKVPASIGLLMKTSVIIIQINIIKRSKGVFLYTNIQA
jgi:hypothetical protein